MKPILYLNGKRISRRRIARLIGSDALDMYILDALEGWGDLLAKEHTVGIPDGTVSIRFPKEHLFRKIA